VHVHILGICGTLMGSIALLAKAQGHQVSGSDDQVYPPMSTQLEKASIPLQSPYCENSIPAGADLVVLGNAGLGRGNPAVEALLTQRIPYCSGAEFLGRYVLQDKWVIAVSGTHGKTTTASILTWILKEAGLDPGYLIGGVPIGMGPSAAMGSSPFFVIEADEYDTSFFDRRAKFLHYAPQTLIINNLEFDHADIYPDLASIQAQFRQLVRLVPTHGLIIKPAEAPAIDAVLGEGCWSPVITVSLSGEPDLRAIWSEETESQFEVFDNGHRVGTVNWELVGQHNVENALAAIAAARHVGVPLAHAVSALSTFQGVKRRMELICRAGVINVYDDFAHHPTAIQTTLLGVRARVGQDKVIAVIELGSYTMRGGEHASRLSESVRDADQVIWFQPRDVAFDIEAVVQETSAILVHSADALLALLAPQFDAQVEATHLVLMSNYQLDGFRELITERYG
jgi:UDP-N-acetylmuramate: L-alanyl-gamma-D-glutamyl-meso-diaminopimelate ligase